MAQADAVDDEREPEIEGCASAGVGWDERRIVDRADAVGLQVELLVGRVAEDEVQQRRGGVACERRLEAGVDKVVAKTSMRLVRAEPERMHRRDQLGSVTVGQDRVAQRVAASAHPLVPGRIRIGLGVRAAAQDLIGERREQQLLAREVVVERAGLDAELGRDTPHRQVGQAVTIEHPEGVVHHVGAAIAHVTHPIVGRH